MSILRDNGLQFSKREGQSMTQLDAIMIYKVVEVKRDIVILQFQQGSKIM